MRAPLTQHDIDQLVMSARSAGKHRAAAAQQEANQPRPADADATPAFLLVSAGDQLPTSCMDSSGPSLAMCRAGSIT